MKKADWIFLGIVVAAAAAVWWFFIRKKPAPAVDAGVAKALREQSHFVGSGLVWNDARNFAPPYDAPGMTEVN